MTDFITRSVEFNGRFAVSGPIETVFDRVEPYRYVARVRVMKRWERWISQYLARQVQTAQ